MDKQPVAFKLWCDFNGKVIAVEAGDDGYIAKCKPGDVFGKVESMQVGLESFGSFKVTVPPLVVSEVRATGGVKALACCWRIINGRWQCVEC